MRDGSDRGARRLTDRSPAEHPLVGEATRFAGVRCARGGGVEWCAIALPGGVGRRFFRNPSSGTLPRAGSGTAPLAKGERRRVLC